MEYSKMFVQYVCFFHSCIIQPDITPTGAVLQMCSIQWTLPIGHRKKKKKKAGKQGSFNYKCIHA